MATYSRVSPTGWTQGDDASTVARVTPAGWEQFTGAGGGPVTEALSGSAVTSGQGNEAPVFEIPL